MIFSILWNIYRIVGCWIYRRDIGCFNHVKRVQLFASMLHDTLSMSVIRPLSLNKIVIKSWLNETILDAIFVVTN